MGAADTVVKSVDAGVTWTASTTGVLSRARHTWYDVAFVDERRGWIAGSYGSVLRTTDGGASWRAQVGPPLP